MEVVSELYGRGIYYLPQVMVAADAFDIGLKFAERTMKGQYLGKGKVVMHVVEGDPHDIGKNIAVVLFRSNGFGSPTWAGMCPWRMWLKQSLR